MVVVAALLLATTAGIAMAIPREVVTAWKVDPPGSPKSLTSEAEIDALHGRFIAPVFIGGLGNVMYQIAVASIKAKRADIPCLVGWWDQERPKYGVASKVFHGRGDALPGITLKKIFPNIQYVDFYPRYRDVLSPVRSMEFEYNPNQVPDNLADRGIQFISGYFFNTIYWHYERDFLLHHVFKFHPVMISYIRSEYLEKVDSSLETVSVHTRFGGANEPSMGNILERGLTHEWYIKAMFEEFDPAKTFYYIFTDNVEEAQNLVLKAKKHYPLMKVLIVNEDFAISMAMFSMCKHHIVTNSTFGFWGAYLDKNQPNGGKTVVHAKFEKANGGYCHVPYDEWIRRW